MWSVDSGDVKYACCRSASARRSLTYALDIFAEICFVHKTVVVL